MMLEWTYENGHSADIDQSKLMSRESPALDPGFLVLDGGARVPLGQQLYDALRSAICSGQLGRGHRLPSTRDLAHDLGVSRTTVVYAFDQLVAEGYLESCVGRGTFVCSSVPEDKQLVRHERRRARKRLEADRSVQSLRLFRAGVPAVDEFPLELWSRLLRARWKHCSPSQLAYGAVEGYGALREAIADYLRAFRGVRCEVGQVFVVHGTQQAIDVVSRLLVREGDELLIENPGYRKAQSAFRAAGAKLVPMAVDEHGMRTDTLRRHPQARLAYVTPSHQFPMGVTLSLERRIALLEWASKSNAYLMEDDYDSEYRYVGRPLASLQGLDPNERVIYTGSFSKTVLPSLSCAYLVVPSALVDRVKQMLTLSTRPPATLDQTVLCDFLSQGHFARHLRRMRKIYELRRTAFVESAEKHLGHWLEVVGSDAGLHCTARLADGLDQKRVRDAVRAAGIEVASLAEHDLAPGRGGPQGLIFGFACGTVPKIQASVRKLRQVLEGLPA